MNKLRAWVLLVPLSACASTGAVPSDPASGGAVVAVAGSPVERDRLQAGHALFQARCQRCHALPIPSRVSPDAWPAEVASMARKSGLSADQVALVTDYLVAASRLGSRPN